MCYFLSSTLLIVFGCNWYFWMIPDHRHIRVCCGIFDFLHFCHRNEIFLSKYSNENFLGLILKVCFRLKKWNWFLAQWLKNPSKWVPFSVCWSFTQKIQDNNLWHLRRCQHLKCRSWVVIRSEFCARKQMLIFISKRLKYLTNSLVFLLTCLSDFAVLLCLSHLCYLVCQTKKQCGVKQKWEIEKTHSCYKIRRQK